jgi:hypothetical protein
MEIGSIEDSEHLTKEIESELLGICDDFSKNREGGLCNKDESEIYHHINEKFCVFGYVFVGFRTL